MRIFRHTDGLPADARGAVLVIGNFDGVHLGHQAVIGHAREIAARLGAPVAVLTFEPHPRRVFQPDVAPFRLTSLRAKSRLLEAAGVDLLFVQHFDREFSQITADDFIANILVGGIGISHVVVGSDFAFGHKRGGNVAMLEREGATAGFGVTPAPVVESKDGAVISSNTIRKHLSDGEPEAAARLLGHRWEVDGRVAHGDARGRDLGFPTANLKLGEYLHPRPGVYAVRAGVDDGAGTRWYAGAANFGTRPQFDGEGLLLEVHLLDFAGDLYGATLRVEFVSYLRAEERFADVDALVAQMERDCAQVRAVLEASTEG
jgi:riboflavin kinase/FMN adenylyltransferase